MAQAVSHRQSAQTVGTSSRPHPCPAGRLSPARGRIAPFRRVVPFRRVARAAKQIVKARKPQSCALFSFQILRFCSRYPAFCSCVPVLCSGGRPFYFRWSGILPPVARNSTSAAQDSAPTAHSISPKGNSPLPYSAFQFPTFSITFPKPTFTTSRPTSPVRAHKNPDFVLQKMGRWHRES